MRYGIAIAVTSLTLGAFLLNHWWGSAQLARAEQQVRRQLSLPAGAPLPEVGIDLPRHVILSIQVDDFFQRLWFVLIPLVFVTVLGIEATISLIQGKPIPPGPSQPVSPPE